MGGHLFINAVKIESRLRVASLYGKANQLVMNQVSWKPRKAGGRPKNNKYSNEEEQEEEEVGVIQLVTC